MYGQQRELRVGVSPELMASFIEDVLSEWMPGWLYDAVSDRHYRLTYLSDNVIRVEPSGVEAARVFVVGVTVREIR